MKHDLSRNAFIIPIKIESDDRLRNVITSICFLLDNFDTTVMVKEVDDQSRFVKKLYHRFLSSVILLMVSFIPLNTVHLHHFIVREFSTT